MWQQQCQGDTRYPQYEWCACTAMCQVPQCLHLQMPNQHLPSTQTPECIQQATVIPPWWMSSTHPQPHARMGPPRCWALPFLQRHGQSQSRAAGKGRHCLLASRVQGGHGSQERQKKWLSPASRVQLAIARQFHKNAH